MIHLKIYEAFESRILGKTMAFIDKDSRISFMEEIKKLADAIDFPISEFSDDQFQYLPFRKALNLNSTSTDKPCDATSEQAFPDFPVPGEVCNGGMIKRKWGNSVRTVKCTICGGTGVKPNTESNIKWVKFWFNKDGKFVTTTVTDGKIRPTYGSETSAGDGTGISKNLSDYENVRQIENREMKTLPTGTVVKIRTTSFPNYHVAVIWQARDGSTFAIQNNSSGGEDTETRDWKKYGRYSWSVPGDDTYDGTWIIQLKNETETEAEADPYTWNAPSTWSRWSKGIQVGSRSLTKEDIKEAHFALVLDYEELKKKEFTKKSETMAKRAETKTGVLAFKSDEEIRKANINNYIEKLADKIEITDDLRNFNQLILRMLGWSNCGWYVLLGKNISTINDIVSYVVSLMKQTDMSNKVVYAEEIKKLISARTRENIVRNENITMGLQRAYKAFQEQDTDRSRKLIEIIDHYFELNRAIYKLLKSIKTETVEDIEIIYNKMVSIRRMFEDNSRYREARRIRYFLDYIDRKNNWEYLDSEIFQPDDTIEEMKRLISVVGKY